MKLPHKKDSNYKIKNSNNKNTIIIKSKYVCWQASATNQSLGIASLLVVFWNDNYPNGAELMSSSHICCNYREKIGSDWLICCNRHINIYGSELFLLCLPTMTMTSMERTNDRSINYSTDWSIFYLKISQEIKSNPLRFCLKQLNNHSHRQHLISYFSTNKMQHWPEVDGQSDPDLETHSWIYSHDKVRQK